MQVEASGRNQAHVGPLDTKELGRRHGNHALVHKMQVPASRFKIQADDVQLHGGTDARLERKLINIYRN